MSTVYLCILVYEKKYEDKCARRNIKWEGEEQSQKFSKNLILTLLLV